MASSESSERDSTPPWARTVRPAYCRENRVCKNITSGYLYHLEERVYEHGGDDSLEGYPGEQVGQVLQAQLGDYPGQGGVSRRFEKRKSSRHKAVQN